MSIFGPFLHLCSLCVTFPTLPLAPHFPEEVVLLSVHSCIKQLSSHYLDITARHLFHHCSRTHTGSMTPMFIRQVKMLKLQKGKKNVLVLLRNKHI